MTSNRANQQPIASDVQEVIPGLEGFDVIEVAAPMAIEGIAAEMHKRTPSPTDIGEVSYREEVKINQGVGNYAMAKDEIPATTTAGPPPKKPRQRKKPRETDGRMAGHDIEQADARDNPVQGKPMPPEMLAARARMNLENDARHAQGDPRVAVTRAATRDYRSQK